MQLIARAQRNLCCIDVYLGQPRPWRCVVNALSLLSFQILFCIFPDNDFRRLICQDRLGANQKGERVLSAGISVDSPHRERLGYLGDAHSSLETALSNVASDRFYAKWLTDIIDVQGYPAVRKDKLSSPFMIGILGSFLRF